MTAWEKQDSTAARLMGWDVYEIWDGRLIREIQKDDRSNIFPNDEAARHFVESVALSGNALANKARHIVFNSKLGAKPTGKKK